MDAKGKAYAGSYSTAKSAERHIIGVSEGTLANDRYLMGQHLALGILYERTEQTCNFVQNNSDTRTNFEQQWLAL